MGLPHPRPATMSYALSRPSPLYRSSLLATVVGAHVGLLLVVVAARTIAPQIMELPLVVELLPPVEQPVQHKPLPIVAPKPVPQKIQAKKIVPVLETTTSEAPAPTAPMVAPSPPAPPAPAPAPVQEAIVQPRFDADYLKNPAPPYPPLSRRLGEEGKVILRVLVSPGGTAETVEIKTSSGSPRLDEAAAGTVRQWRFVPARRGETALQSWVLVPIIFKLEH